MLSSSGPRATPSDPTSSSGVRGRLSRRRRPSRTGPPGRERRAPWRWPNSSRPRRPKRSSPMAAWYRGDRDAVEPHYERAYGSSRRSRARRRRRPACLRSRRAFGCSPETPEDGDPGGTRGSWRSPRSSNSTRSGPMRSPPSDPRRTASSSRAGRDELENAVAVAIAADSPIAGTTMNNLAVVAVWEGDFARAYEIYAESMRLSERFGERDGLRFVRGNWIFAAFALGHWDEALTEADAFVAECASSPHYAEGIVREAGASIRLGRGDLAGAAEDRDFVLGQARRLKTRNGWFRPSPHRRSLSSSSATTERARSPRRHWQSSERTSTCPGPRAGSPSVLTR